MPGFSWHIKQGWRVVQRQILFQAASHTRGPNPTGPGGKRGFRIVHEPWQREDVRGDRVVSATTSSWCRNVAASASTKSTLYCTSCMHIRKWQRCTAKIDPTINDRREVSARTLAGNVTHPACHITKHTPSPPDPKLREKNEKHNIIL